MSDYRVNVDAALTEVTTAEEEASAILRTPSTATHAHTNATRQRDSGATHNNTRRDSANNNGSGIGSGGSSHISMSAGMRVCLAVLLLLLSLNLAAHMGALGRTHADMSVGAAADAATAAAAAAHAAARAAANAAANAAATARAAARVAAGAGAGADVECVSLPAALPPDPSGRVAVRVPFLWEWHRFNSTFHNFGYPSVLVMCKDAATQLPDPSRTTDAVQQCSRIQHALSRMAHTAAYADWNATVYATSAAQSLISSPGRVLSWLPMRAGHASTGPWVMHALANELARLGVPTKMFQQTRHIPGYYDASLNVDWGKDSVDWSDPWFDAEDLILVSPEGNGWFPDASYDTHLKPRQGRVIKWILGWHGSPEGQTQSTQLPIPFTAYSGSAFYSPRLTPLWAPDPLAVRDAAALYDRASAAIKKEKLVLIDNDSPFPESVRKALPDVKFQVFSGFTREQSIELYQRAMVTVDFGLGGGEAINSEGTLFDCVTVISYDRFGTSNYDFAFPQRYKVNRFNETNLAQLIRDAVDNYDTRILEFRRYKQVVTAAQQRFVRDLAVYFHARDVVFYLYAPDLETLVACHATIVSIKHVYPLARIELLTPFTRDDVSHTHAMLFFRQHADMLHWVSWQQMPREHTSEPADPLHLFLTRTSRKFSAFTVMVPHATVLLLGSDFLNEQVRFIETNKLIALAFAAPDIDIDRGTPHQSDGAKATGAAAAAAAGAAAPSISIDPHALVVVQSSAYWSQVESLGATPSERWAALRAAGVPLTPAGLFQHLQLPIQPHAAANGDLPLPLDHVVFDLARDRADFRVTRHWSIPLVMPGPRECYSRAPVDAQGESSDPVQRALSGPGGACSYDDLVFSRFRLTPSHTLPPVVRQLLGLLHTEPMWQRIQSLTPDIYQLLRLIDDA